jgi:hypothetical protein
VTDNVQNINENADLTSRRKAINDIGYVTGYVTRKGFIGALFGMGIGAVTGVIYASIRKTQSLRIAVLTAVTGALMGAITGVVGAFSKVHEDPEVREKIAEITTTAESFRNQSTTAGYAKKIDDERRRTLNTERAI